MSFIQNTADLKTSTTVCLYLLTSSRRGWRLVSYPEGSPYQRAPLAWGKSWNCLLLPTTSQRRPRNRQTNSDRSPHPRIPRTPSHQLWQHQAAMAILRWTSWRISAVLKKPSESSTQRPITNVAGGRPQQNDPQLSTPWQVEWAVKSGIWPQSKHV